MEPGTNGAMYCRPTGKLTGGGRCVVCQERPAELLLQVDEPADQRESPEFIEAPLSASAWLMCGLCAADVREETARVHLRSPLHTHIAVAVVASKHNRVAPQPVWSTHYWRYADARTQDRWMTPLILICFAVFPIIGIVLAVLPVLLH